MQITSRLVVAATLLLTIAGCRDDQETASGFILYKGVQIDSNPQNQVILPLAIADGETAELSIGASYSAGAKSERNSAEVVIERDGKELKVVTFGRGGEPLVWKNRTGPSIQCTKTLTETRDAITFSYVITLADDQQAGKPDDSGAGDL